MKLDGRRKSLTVLLFALTYMVSYITRINYGAVISEMEAEMQISKKLLSMALTGSFITYGIGQTLVGIIGERISPKKLVAFGLSATAVMNFAIPLCKSPWAMLAVWSVNGFAQSFMWPPLVKMMVELLSSDDYKRASVRVQYGSSLGTITVYLLSPLIISIGSFKTVFFTSCVLAVIMLVLWCLFSPNPEIKPAEQKEKCRKNVGGKIFSPIFLLIMPAIVCMGILRDGITTWMPSYISETYNTDNLAAILTGVILPVFAMICYKAVLFVYQRKLKNPIACTAIIYIISVSASLILLLTTGKSPVASILSMAILTAAMHGVNLMLITMLPPFFKNTGKVSTVSGILNSCTYLGSAISTYGVALIAEGSSWTAVIITWLAVAVLGTAISLCTVAPWKKRMSAQE